MKISARQTHGFAVRLGKICTTKFFLKIHVSFPWSVEGDTILCRVFYKKRTANKIFVVCFFGHMAKSFFAVHFFFGVRPIKNYVK
jgi:hypothetical protein